MVYMEQGAVPGAGVRGEQSDLLLADTAEQMTTSGPEAELAVLAGMGHAPTLMSEDQIALVSDWLSA